MADTQLNQPGSTLPAAKHNLLTADDLAKQPNGGTRYELVKGVLQKCHLLDLSTASAPLKSEADLTYTSKRIN